MSQIGEKNIKKKFGIKYLLSFLVLQISSKMSNISQGKDPHWKLFSNRKSRIDSEFEPESTRKRFTPLKDTSMHNSKVFQKSRQRSIDRSNSSFVGGLNKSPQMDAKSSRQKKKDNNSESVRVIAPEPTALISTIKNSQFHANNSELVAKQAQTMSTLNQLQKQFKQFKGKIMKLIQRQQQQINQLAKEILNTFQFQLAKLKDLKFSQCQHCQTQSETLKHEEKSIEPQKKPPTNSKVENNLKTKQIQDLKQQLNKKLQKIQRNNSVTKNDEKDKMVQKQKSTRQIPIINFQKIHSRFDNVFDIFNKLKSDMNEMEQIRASLQKKNKIENIPSLKGGLNK